MDFLNVAVPLAKVALAFVVMLVAIRKRIALPTCILGGSFVLALLFGLGPVSWGRAALSALWEQELMSLAVIVGLILVLSDILEQSGQGERLMRATSTLMRSHRLRLIFFPALIGLLPMPGGALFSAPMVRSAAGELPVDATRQAMLNYWFRHIWELTWPLYPVLILASALTGMTIAELVALTWPSLVMSLTLGWLFYLRPGVLPLPPSAGRGQTGPREFGKALRESLPILTALVGALVLDQTLDSVVPGLPDQSGFILALVLSIAVVAAQNGWSPARVLRTVFQRRVAGMVWLVLTIFIFKQVVEAGGVVTQLSQAASGDAALFVVTLVLPLLVGLICGISMAFVGTTFPLLLGLLEHMHVSPGVRTAYVVFGLMAGYTGVLASPLHACLLMTCDYFGVGLERGWKSILRPSAIFLAFAVAYFFVLRTWLA
ncbi:protein of unknown function DUF401 [Desulfovibrio sp. X2]|uniref:DUF401 family protein n=1 Tax=Desulfovibrio sp. X2 TaxID=941449 RepID=UPI0003587F2F|nr:DUF401 family protein [Desulfovibrio sp. X2]EPR37648.1 protein of unknown function DUF401 [Desulfovibrio sp. X2]